MPLLVLVVVVLLVLVVVVVVVVVLVLVLVVVVVVVVVVGLVVVVVVVVSVVISVINTIAIIKKPCPRFKSLDFVEKCSSNSCIKHLGTTYLFKMSPDSRLTFQES